MTNQQVWRWLANDFRNIRYRFCEGWISASGSEGICAAKGRVPLSASQREMIDREINEERRRLGKSSSAYLWPTNEKGAASRVAFCKRMARKYAPKPEGNDMAAKKKTVPTNPTSKFTAGTMPELTKDELGTLLTLFKRWYLERFPVDDSESDDYSERSVVKFIESDYESGHVESQADDTPEPNSIGD